MHFNHFLLNPPTKFKWVTLVVIVSIASPAQLAYAEISYKGSQYNGALSIPQARTTESIIIKRVGSQPAVNYRPPFKEPGQVTGQVFSQPVQSYPNAGYPATSYSSPTYPTASTHYSVNDTSINYFNEAESASNSGDTSALYQYEQMMSGGLFAMYPVYWRLNNDLATLSPSAVTQFVRQYSDSVMAEKLAADYAEVKAKSGDYSAVRQVANLITNADASEECAIALGYNNTGDSIRTMTMKPKVWLTTRKQPALCQQLATEMINNPTITPADREQRLLRMLREGRTGDIIALAQSLGVSIDYADLSEIQLSPNRFFAQFSKLPSSKKNQYLYLYAIGRMADKSYREAGIQLDFDVSQDNLRRHKLLAESTRQYAYRILGVKRMNMNTDDGFNQEAVNWFRLSVGLPFNFEEAEDYAQAAIRFSQWQDVILAVGSMDPVIQKESIWQYWLARAYEHTNNSSLATQIYQTLSNQNNYYGFLAKDKLNKRFNSAEFGGNQLPNISPNDRQRVMQNPSFARAFILYDAGASRRYAQREWNWAVKQARDNQDTSIILAAARMAYDKGWLDRAVYAIDSSEGIENLALSYPTPYEASVIKYSNNVGIDPAWAYGIMRQESRFVSAAHSGVGASGLMQIMPATARYIARNLGESYSASRANSGETNIRYGTWYMGDVLASLDYQPVLATAGYNAGPNKAKRWQPVYGALAADQYVDTIAYPETRDYVKRVMENTTIYAHLLGRPTSITQRMGIIPASY